MALTPFRGVTYLELSSGNAITQSNNALNNLVRGLSGFVLINIAGTGTLTLTDTNDDDQAKHLLLILTGVLTGARAVVLPTAGRVYLVVNASTGAFATTMRTAAGTGVVVSQGTATWVYFDDQDDDIHAVTGSASADTASNIGAGGIGLFKQKAGVNFEFRNVNAASSKVTVVLDAGNNEVDIDVDPAAIAAEIDLGDLGTIPDAEADGATKGIATFDADDFDDDTNGLITLDYVNAQKATGAQPGFLTAADWQTFNNKLGGFRTKALTDALTNVFEVTLPAGTEAAGTLTAFILAKDGTETQWLTQEIFWQVINKAGVYTLTVVIRADEVASLTAGTLSATWALTSGASKAIMSITPTGSLTETTYEVRYTLINYSTQAITYL